MAEGEAKDRSIPSLDGLRALSVLIVILGHTRSAFLDRIPLNLHFRYGGQGVAVFFVISGFLITHLLQKELKRTGQINLKRFYLRRTFRIFPPFYVYLLVVMVLANLNVVQASLGSMLAAATYTWNYVLLPDTWIIGHCWSLTLEEQFYLLWPACMAYFSRRANLKIATAVILLSPVSRVATYFLWPAMRGHLGMMLHTHLDTIMMGCLLSLILDMKVWRRSIQFLRHRATVAASAVFLLLLDVPASIRWKGGYSMTVGVSLENVAIAAILLYAVFHHDSFFGRILNLRPVRHMGAISYGLYLWQQLFTGPHTHLFPLNILWIVACAELSYFFVERPSFRVRDLVQKRLWSTRPPRPGPNTKEADMPHVPVPIGQSQ